MDKISKIKSNLQYVDNFLFENNYLNTCLENCSDCCYDYFYTSLFEFYLILDKLLNVPYNLNYYIDKANKSYTYFSKYFPNEIKRLDPLYSNRLLSSVVSDFSVGQYINYKQLPACILLRNGLCDAYLERPNTCRKYGTIVLCEYLNNQDYQDDEYTNKHLNKLTLNTLLVNDNDAIEFKKYPLWFYFSYFLKDSYRDHVINHLKFIKNNSEEEVFNALKKG